MSETERINELRGFLMDLKDSIADTMVQISDEGEGEDFVPTDKAVKFMDYNLFLLVILHCLEIIDDTDYQVEQMALKIDEILGGK